MAPKPVITYENAIIYTFVGAFGTMILAVLGYGFDHEWEPLTGSKHDPNNPHVVAGTCYTASVIYAGLALFTAVQLVLHARAARGGDIHL